MLLEKIEQSSDIKKLKEEDYPVLAKEIRQFLLEKISKTGGHLASNLVCGKIQPGRYDIFYGNGYDRPS